MLLTAILVLLTAGQSYKEDISDFLPLENEQQEAFMEYQNTSSARRIYVIFQSPDNDCQPAVDLFTEMAEQLTAKSQKPLAILQGDDPEVVQEAMNTIYARMPYLLTADDYARIDSITETPDFMDRQLENDKQMLMLPSGGMAAMQIQHDPLNLFASVLARQKPTNQANSVMLLIDSPFGASETEHNAALVAMLQQVCDSVGNAYPDVSIHLTGGPVIAVGNAQQIKKDSIISITFAAILILLLLWLVFRNVRNMMLIAVSIAWGWLFAMGCLTLVHNDVSIIVIGISSVILGIAVNYPLHLIAHLSHTTDVRTALKEIRMPLVVGNVTTVGAFLALVPLQSVALRDLGLFSAFLLVGTIIFVLVWLPHMVQKGADLSHHCVPHSDLQVREPSAIRLLERLGDVQLENKRWIVGMVVALTVVLGYFSFQTSFDADLRNINYMTDEQRQDMKLLEQPSMVNGQWSMFNGQWSMVNGQPVERMAHHEGCRSVSATAAESCGDGLCRRFVRRLLQTHVPQPSNIRRSTFNVQRSTFICPHLRHCKQSDGQFQLHRLGLRSHRVLLPVVLDGQHRTGPHIVPAHGRQLGVDIGHHVAAGHTV